MSRTIRIGLAQLSSEVGDIPSNLEAVAKVLKQTQHQHVDIVVFPELFLPGYRADHAHASLALDSDSKDVQQLHHLASGSGVALVLGTGRKSDKFPNLTYNSALIVAPGTEAWWYDKVHLASNSQAREACYFAPGRAPGITDLVLPRLSEACIRIGVQICYDAWFPEVTRTLTRAGAELNVILAAGPKGFEDAWASVVPTRCLENLLPAVFVNTVGRQQDSEFFGGSLAVDCQGTPLAELPQNREAFEVVEIDLNRTKRVRQEELLWRDVQDELYKEWKQHYEN